MNINDPDHYPLGQEVYNWPEFIAFAQRLGLRWELSTINVTITIPLEGAVIIAHDYVGKERHLISLPKDEG